VRGRIEGSGDAIEGGAAGTRHKLPCGECDPSHSVHIESIAPEIQQFIEVDADSVT